MAAAVMSDLGDARGIPYHLEVFDAAGRAEADAVVADAARGFSDQVRADGLWRQQLCGFVTREFTMEPSRTGGAQMGQGRGFVERCCEEFGSQWTLTQFKAGALMDAVSVL